MNISEWLDRKEAEGVDVSQIELPGELLFDAVPDETVFFETYNPCSILCAREHPYATVERYGRWYCGRGQDKKAGIHRTGMEWRFNTRNKDLAIRTARSHIE
ncbi:MAG: hypothetical protein A4E67_01335 [Syntrophaceae bacterium PtaB.Bin038]|nr:MAG: hypothetical protein A4E67_01335 [Syntrophaceae bacterium PtaB.Bin038]